MVTKAKSLTDHHLSLLRAYFLVLQRVDRFPRLIWVPIRWLGFVRVPVLTVAVRVFVSSHIKRVLEALDRAYQRRLAIDESSPEEDDWKELHEQADWKELQEQAELMDASLTPFLLAKWVFATLAIVLVILVARGLPHGDLVIKMAVAAVTVNPEKLAELAAEPGAMGALGRLGWVMVMILTALTPILIYHFRFKRALFNHPELLVASGLDVTFGNVWGERSVSVESLYLLERDLFMALGDPVLPEVSLDLLAVIIDYLYVLLGQGLLVGILAWQVFALNRSAGFLLFFVAAFNALIGLFMVFKYRGEIRQRSKRQAEA